MDTRQVKNNPISQDALKSVSDEILKKKKRKRKIALAIISFVVLALAVMIITLSLVQINLKPFFIETPARYSLVYEGRVMANYTDGSTDFDDFDSLLNNSFTQPILTGIFNGQLGNYEVLEERGQSFYSDSESQSGMHSNLTDKVGSTYIQLHYGVEQRIYNKDGSVYYSPIYTNRYDLKYVDIYIPLSENTDSVTIYFGTYGDHVNSAYISSITIDANISQVYDYVANL